MVQNAAKFRNFYSDIGFGLVSGHSRVAQIGHNSDVDTTTVPEDIWSGGGLLHRPAAASILEVLSSSASDTSAGTGSRTVFRSGLNSLYNVISETVTLNGTTPVQTVNQYLRVNVFRHASAGSGELNVGDITLRITGGGATMGIIEAWVGIASSSSYTVPAWFTLKIESLVFSYNRSWGSPQSATVRTCIRSPLWFIVMPLPLDVQSTSGPYLHQTDSLGIVIAEKFDFSLRCTYTSANNADITAGFIWILRQNQT